MMPNTGGVAKVASAPEAILGVEDLGHHGGEHRDTIRGFGRRDGASAEVWDDAYLALTDAYLANPAPASEFSRRPSGPVGRPRSGSRKAGTSQVRYGDSHPAQT